GYPDGLKGEDIPEAARIIAAADAYDLLASETDMTPPMPAQLIREQFVQKSGQQLDPKYAKIVMQLLDRMEAERTEDASSTVAAVYENEFVCNEYRDHVMAGIVVENEPTRIRMKCDPAKNAESDFYCPSLIVFDSYDGRVHDTQKEIDAFRYTEFGEVWFDGHIVCNGARNMEVNVHRRSSGPDIPGSEDDASSYEIITYRQNDHVRIIINSEETSCDVTVALPDSSLFAYIGLTGEHCHTSNVTIEKMENASNLEDIPRIADPISYIDRLESDLPNVQIDGKRSASTEGVRITDGMRIIFHTMSLPSADLIWHCPYIILFSSKDGTVGGEDYTEYGLIGMHGETRKTDEIAQNVIAVDRDDDFVGWDEWKEANHKGLECIVHFRKLGNRITVITQNSGIRIENETTIMDSVKDVYAAITGDQVAITDIRVKKT
ncbi:MAG: diguanylate cyclase, partial [Lachnospiraceae bacterium]|nr:diguanylate cyclase [Lachnospiraceae bacterium]